MKCKDLTSYGVSGKRVEFNLMDCYEASHTLARIDDFLNARENEKAGLIVPTPLVDSEIDCLLQMMKNLLSKIAIKPSEMPNIFDEEESEEKES